MDAKRALLELCFEIEEKHTLVARREEMNEKRMLGDKDFTGMIVSRFMEEEEKKQFEQMGYKVYLTEKDCLAGRHR